jgi:hypothetical protein
MYYGAAFCFGASFYNFTAAILLGAGCSFAGGSITEYIIAAIITGTCSIIATVIGKEAEQLQEYRQEAIGFRQENERLKQEICKIQLKQEIYDQQHP